MSALTKLFVILLVVCSLLLTASVVVYVNRVENFQQANNTTERKLQAAEARANDLANQVQILNQQKTDGQNALRGQLATRDTTINALQQSLADAQSSNADLSVKLQTAVLALQEAAEGQKAAQAMSAQLHQQSGDLRSDVDKLVKSNVDLNAAVSDLTNKLEVTTRDMRFYQEQLTQAQAKSQQLEARVKDLGGSTVSLAAAGTGAGAPAINGVIRETRDISGVPYATISVGSSDNVVKGMKFNVIDRQQGTFLGILTVDTVEPNAATGRLEGPRLNQVGPGSEVRTQL